MSRCCRYGCDPKTSVAALTCSPPLQCVCFFDATIRLRETAVPCRFAQDEPEIVDSTPINDLFSDAFSRPLPSADGADEVQLTDSQLLRRPGALRFHCQI